MSQQPIVRNAPAESDGADLPVVVVTGLPRSGTSMMMQMLAAGGVPVLSDHKRRADENNPHGYLEDERVKSLASDGSWLIQSRGQAVKIVAPLIPHLPPGCDFRAILMRRRIEEVLASQDMMLSRLGKQAAVVGNERLAVSFSKMYDRAVATLNERTDCQFITVDFADAIDRPGEVGDQVAAFLDGFCLSPAALSSAVDPSLYRTGRS